MKSRIGMAIMSHLSDAQLKMKAGMVEEANHELNFVKLCVHQYDDMNEEVEWSTLDEIWNTAAKFK
jgi:hypothetical protein